MPVTAEATAVTNQSEMNYLVQHPGLCTGTPSQWDGTRGNGSLPFDTVDTNRGWWAGTRLVSRHLQIPTGSKHNISELK